MTHREWDERDGPVHRTCRCRVTGRLSGCRVWLMGSIDPAAGATSGWQAFDPDDPTLSPELRQLHESSQRPELGSVQVTVYDLAKGGSAVSVGGPGAGTVELIDAAIAELQEARRIFAAGGPSTGADAPSGS